MHPPSPKGHQRAPQSRAREGRSPPPGTAHGPPFTPQTQPVPNPMAYFLHHSPWWFHRFETLSNHFLELVVPFFVFLGRQMCILHGALQILFQVSSRLSVPKENLKFSCPVHLVYGGLTYSVFVALLVLPPSFCSSVSGGPCAVPPQMMGAAAAGVGHPTPGGATCGLLGWLFIVAISTKFSCFFFTRKFYGFCLGYF